MSANTCEVSKIQDEDVLRKMWQDTEDFGRKKEIRAHMYKVREARLKDLYSSGTETQSQMSVQKSSKVQTTHADSLADQSFLSLKSKEVRDSESPTRDVAFNNKINVGNTGWTITSAEDTSKDGKTHTAVQTATTSGTEKIDKGISNYAAKAQQKTSVYQDGDVNNFIKAVGMTDASTIQQEASGGDEFSSFKTSASTSKSSSKTVKESHHSKTGGDTIDYSIPKETIPANAKTVVYTETKTLPDGSKVTTTKYETRGGSSSSSSTVQKMSSTSSEQKSSAQRIADQRTCIDSGVDTVDFNKDLAKKVHISDSTSKQLVQQETLRDSKQSETISSSTLRDSAQHASKVQTQEVKAIEPVTPKRIEPSPVREEPKSPRKEPESAKPERRQMIKPVTPELEVSSKATEGQYDTTYRAEFTNKKIHVDVSATHDAFARSLRALTPDDLKITNYRSSKSSNNSLRSSQSPDKMRHPSRVSPDRLYSGGKSPKRYTSPEKSYGPRGTTPEYSPDRVTAYSTDTITRRKKVSDDRRSRESTTNEKVTSRSRSISPTTTAVSDFEYISRRKSSHATDLVDESKTMTRTTTETGDSRPSTLNYSKKSKKITERSPTSPLTDFVPKKSPSPGKDVATSIRRTSWKEEQQQKTEKVLRRSDTYEERCRQILGIPEKKKPQRNVSDIIDTDRRTYRTASRDKILTQEDKITRKPSLPDAARVPSKSPEKCTINGFYDKKSPAKERPEISEFPSQIRRSPERKAFVKYPEKQSPSKDKSTIGEFPSQIRKTPEKQPLEKYPGSKSPKKSQFRRSPERETSPSYMKGQSPIRDTQKISEFPSQIRRSPEKEKYPEKTCPVKEAATKLSEFPSQIRKTPEREPLIKPPERQSPPKEMPKISEFPSQIRKTPEREPLPKYPERESPTKETTTISEFPSQIRRTPEREPLVKPPERKSPSKEKSSVSEFPSQVPEYPEKKIPSKDAPTICEFPSQIRKSPERDPLPEYPQKQQETKEPSKISEFPSQIRRSPAGDNIVPSTITDNAVTTEDVVTTKKKSKPLTEFPAQTKKAPKPSPEDKVLQETIDFLYKDKIPVDEPMFTKKFIAELGSDDECEITVDEHGNTKINTIDDEEIYSQEMQNIQHRTVKKDSPERQFIRQKLSQERDQTIKQQIDEFITTERNDIYRTTESRKSSPDLRKSPERGILKHTSQFDEKSEITTKKSRDDKIKKQSTTTTETKKTKPTNYSTTKKHLVRDTSETKLNISTVTTTSREVREITDAKTKPILAKTPSNKTLATRKTDNTTKCAAKTCCDAKLDTITKTSLSDSKVTKRFIQKPESKRHVVTTTINVTPKSTTRAIKNITNTSIIHVKPKTITIPARVSAKPTIRVENIENEEKVAQKKRIDKLVRTNIDHTVKSPIRGIPAKADLTKKTPDVKDKKCITTKTILINNTVADEREIIVDLLRSTSTREDTRNTVCPVKNNDVKGSPRYPDQVVEPDDFSAKYTPRKLPTIPIDEYEDLSDFVGVTDVTSKDVIKEESTEETVDESLLSVNEKVSKFTNKRQPKNLGPAPKVERPILIIDEKLESDECLLSVSEKVNKFVNKAEKLSLSDIPERPRSPRCQNIVDITDLDENDESLISVSDKVTHFVTTAENVKKPQTSTIKIEKTDLSTVDESLKTDQCLLSVSDKVTKFISTAETLTTKKDETTPKKPAKQRPSNTSEETEEQTYTRTSPQRQTTPKTVDRTSPTRRTSIKEERRNSRKDSSSSLTSKNSTAVTDIETTPKTSRPSTTKSFLGGTTPLRSTESIRKAKALFESMASGTENREVKTQKDIFSRPSVLGSKKKPETITVRRLTPDRDDVKLKDIGIKESTTTCSSKTFATARKLSFTGDDDYKTSTTNILLEKARTSELDSSPDNLDVPGYMKPLDRSLRSNSPHRSSVTDIAETVHSQPAVLPEVSTSANKFGVTLRRLDSDKNVTSTTSTTERKKSFSSILKNHEIEEIYELDILEVLLETTVGYDLRRRIRAQIRLVNNLIAEDKLKIINLKPTITRDVPETKVFTRKSPDIKSPIRDVPETKSYTRKPSETNLTEYQTKYIRKSSVDTRAINNHLYDHSKLVDSKVGNDKSTEYQSSYSRKSSSTTTVLKSRETSPAKSPEKSKCKTTPPKYFQTELKKVDLNAKSSKDNKPDWVINRTLRKIADTPSPVANKYSSNTTRTTVAKQVRASGFKDSKPTDVITSSYGIGPMDENGSPLFGLKALRTQSNMDTSKVQGTITQSHFYSENGQEPIGETSVTKYSTDPADFSSDEELTKEEQKIGYKGTTSITGSKQLSEIENDNRTNKSTTKFTRRGSVKEMTQKFLENTVDSLKSERQSYPKAGLILRTSSFKDASPTEEHATLSTTTTVRTSTTSSGGQTQKGQTFLTNKSKVTGMQDIVSRMQESNKETREGDTLEDAEARSLLNKFLGSQVILSGIEGCSTQAANNKTTSPRKATTKISTTITEGGTPRTVTRIFTHPITAEDIADISDQESLKLLLEQSSDYDERRVLRARLKEVMAAKEEGFEAIKQSFTDSPLATTTTTQVSTTKVLSQQQVSTKPMSPFAKFKQLDRANSLNTPPRTSN